MCPACMASVALLIGGVMSTGGLTALALKVRRELKARALVQNLHPVAKPKEETWEK
jgi:hypothetical protein